MRLICPNCEAQYEVDERVIPAGGRDVQCSNCGHTWFQAHPDDDLTPVAEPEDEIPPPPAPEPDPEQPVRAEEIEVGEDGLDLSFLHEENAEPEPEVVPDAPPEAEPATRRQLDPKVADLLREEAERESAARRAEAEGLESQPDLGLEEDAAVVAAARQAKARERMARLRGGPAAESSEPDAADAEPVEPATRGGMLPDVDEINSSLRPAAARAEVVVDEEDGAERPRKRGFGRGFTLTIVLAAIASLVYVFAPRIAEALPQAEPYLTQYVDWVNRTRVIVNGWVDMGIAEAKVLIAKAQAMISGGGEG